MRKISKVVLDDKVGIFQSDDSFFEGGENRTETEEVEVMEISVSIEEEESEGEMSVIYES